MKGFVDNIEDAAIRNSSFRQVLYTAERMQLVVMALEPGEDIGEEVHSDRDQYFRVEKGKGEIWIDGTKTKIRKNSAMIVPAGTRHNVLNSGGKVLRLATIYAPPEHQDAIVHRTKADAHSSEEHFDGTVTEPKAKRRSAKRATGQATAKSTAKSTAKTTAKTTAKKPATRSAAKKTAAKKTAAKRPAAKRPATRARSAETD
ncbi:cupin domain-containing protein [Cryobacterium sinapicolor]|uniref:cupin domain-containing protein n=1 Tax=Cryobacterium sinapicolor TaxID=1259236 RepID=UPI0018E06DA0|nr:cupin domain-containing protein [Cryobacterium sinapicolor]